MSYVVPCVLNLYAHLLASEVEYYLVSEVIESLQESLKRRMAGIFINLFLSSDKATPTTPFNHEVYIHAAFLDPNMGLSWLELDTPEHKQLEIKENLKGKLRVLLDFLIIECRPRMGLK